MFGPSPTSARERADREVDDRRVDERGIASQPALDGVRGAAVAMVLLFHGGFTWMSGGYIGVSVFFTLSGYLITSLAIAEHDRTGRLEVGAFYGRRIRRLLPASLVCLAGVMVAAALGQFDGVTNVRRDLWAALAQVYNWVALAGGDSYAQQMARAAGQRAPLDHYWSLSIEEQFYWIWPLVLLVVLRWSSRRRAQAVIAATVTMVGVAVLIARAAGPDAAYFATPARLPEIMLGAVVAVVLAHRVSRGRVVPRPMWFVGGVGSAALVTVAVIWPASGGPATRGWFPALALASAALVVGLQVPSPLRRVLSAAPLVALGRISYGVYLYHWPVGALLDERRLGEGRGGLFVVRTAVTLAVATVSWWFVEQPIRRRSMAWRPVLAGAALSCIAVAAIVVVVPDRDGTYTYVAPSTRAAAAIVPIGVGDHLARFAASGVGDSGLAVGASRPVRVLVTGDSTAHAMGEGMIQWAAEHPDAAQVSTSAVVGCGLDAGGEQPDDAYRATCESMRAGLPALVARLRPDVVIAMVTFRDMEDRQWTAAEGVLTPTDPRFRRHLLDGYEQLIAELLSAGAGSVLWVIAPTPDLPAIGDLAPMLDPDRTAAYRQVVSALPLAFGSEVQVADMDAWARGLESPPERADGLHWTLDGAVEVADQFLIPAAMRAALATTE